MIPGKEGAHLEFRVNTIVLFTGKAVVIPFGLMYFGAGFTSEIAKKVAHVGTEGFWCRLVKCTLSL